MLIQHSLTIPTTQRGMVNITDKINTLIKPTEMAAGLCHIFLHHTSASLVLCENADPMVQADLETFMSKLAPDDNNLYQHTMEGPDDMPAHIRTIITQSFLTIPVTNHKLALGTWQGVYLWEHRTQTQTRRLTVTLFA